MMEKYIKDKKLKDLSDSKKQKVLSQILEAEVLVPVQRVWEAYSQAAQREDCAAKFLCEINQGARKDGGAR